jgi:hypothetical protein
MHIPAKDISNMCALSHIQVSTQSLGFFQVVTQHIHTYVRTYTHSHTYIHKHTYINKHIHTHKYIHVQIVRGQGHQIRPAHNNEVSSRVCHGYRFRGISKKWKLVGYVSGKPAARSPARRRRDPGFSAPDDGQLYDVFYVLYEMTPEGVCGNVCFCVTVHVYVAVDVTETSSVTVAVDVSVTLVCDCDLFCDSGCGCICDTCL